MPFVQRVVQPTFLARPRAAQISDATSVSVAAKRTCIPSSKCSNNNCINQQQETSAHEREAKERGEFNGVARTTASTSANIDTNTHNHHQLQTTKTTALVHQPTIADSATGTQDEPDFCVAPLNLNHTNGFAASFSYATDNEEEPPMPGVCVGGNTSSLLPMKKLKQHVEFLSTTSPTSSSARSGYNAGAVDAAQTDRLLQRRQQQLKSAAAKIVPGYEFDSISNITLSNALRQLASLVLLASDIFEELQLGLQSVGDRSRAVQRKIAAVEKKVCAFDPKMVTVPESDLLTFAQRKTHYESDKTVRKELFTAETRPRSVSVLYEDAGKASPPPSTSFASNNHDGIAEYSGTGASQAAGSDELVYTPIFGKSSRKMRTRIDAEIEIRLPAGIEELRKWTSSEALGDVTVTPDCMHHVDTSINTSLVIGDNGILTPALSPSVLSADAVDALYSVNVSNVQDNTQIPNDINKDVPLNHRLPSPEEQCKIIALRYPAELISVDTSGKRFERMCLARKSTTGCVMNIADSNNLSEEVQTVSRRSRSRKVRGKRRNTIAGIDEKEIRDAANGDSTATSSEIKNSQAPADADADAEDGEELSKRSVEKSKKFGRSKSSDILKKEAVALPYDKGKGTLTRLNSLKQWGRNRFRFMQRADSAVSQNGSGLDASNSSQNTQNKLEAVVSTFAGDKPAKFTSARGDIDDECIVHNRIGQKSEGRFSHERKPSYSSSEKSVSVTSCGHLKGKLHLATCGGNVKLRDTSSLNRQRRNGITINDLAGKEEQPHSSSGNWSASSESGRASIGSEITIQPKSSASNTSLNVSSFHPGSGPPSSMLSRRRFLNTSASSSVTSEGTTTPDLQVPTCDSYNNPLDDETSSAYSCDTEGYYTSFHMDSGLRTLKEEEPPMTPIQQGQASSYSFGSQSNQTVLSAENEYELYGRGSTSTTTSSAGTVCTTLMVNEHNNLTAMLGPDVPERSSSLANGGSDKLNRSNHSNSTSTLERSYSSSTIGSTLERTGTIKRNINAGLKLGVEEVDDSHQRSTTVNETPDSPEDEFDFEHRVRKRKGQPLPPTSSVVAELEYSESSDLEGVERIERIKLKTAINARRIPSMCIITPSTSDDENLAKDAKVYDPCRALLNSGNSVFSKAVAKPETTLNNESSLYSKAVAKPETSLQFKINELTGYCTINMTPDDGITEAPSSPTKNVQHTTLSSPLPTEQPTSLAPDQQRDHNLNVLIKRSSHYGFNHMLEKLKVVLPNIKRSPSKGPSQLSAVVDDDELYDTAGEYVTIADISNNNRLQQPKAAIGLGIYYSNDIVRRSPPEIADDSAAKANEPKNETRRETTEYISLDELPYHLRRIATSDGTDNKEACKNSTVVSANRLPNGIRECAESDSGQSVPMYAEITEQCERPLISPLTKNKGARIKLNAQGRIIYDSDSLKRRKGAHTTFAPGPYVKETESALAKNAVSAELNAANSESGYNSEATKLLLLKQGGVATRRNVANNITSSSSVNEHPQPVIHSSYADIRSQPDNHTIPLLQVGESTMLPSPSTKSTSSTSSSTISSTNSTNTQVSTSSSSLASTKDEVYQRFYKASDQQPTSSATSFQRNSSIYWTLQHRKQPRGSATTSVTCRDDLYATPIRRSERTAKAAALAASANIAANISPIVPRNRSSSVGFLTSTPTKVDWQHSADTIPRQRATRHSNWTNDSPERLETCADRIGQSKTSLMDFKKLLLAKSVKSSPVQKKFSAVELLKKPNAGATPTKTIGNTSSEDSLTPPLPSSATLNSSMKVLDLSGSPKTFANRRMLRHGQFGSPSKSFGPKPRSSPCGWRGHNVVQRTDIMSTTIPEVNSEEDQSSANSNSSRSCSASEFEGIKDRLQTTAADKYSLKHNFFLQTEENNFMRGELRKPFAKAMPLPQVGEGTNQYVSVPGLNRIVRPPSLVDTTNYSKATTAIDANEVGGRTTSALETAL